MSIRYACDPSADARPVITRAEAEDIESDDWWGRVTPAQRDEYLNRYRWHGACRRG
jgi:hypothetical protein